MHQKDEHEIRTVFEQTLAVRVLSPRAKELADRFFFETLVRLHRAGKGAPFTGLKPAGRDLGQRLFPLRTKPFVSAPWNLSFGCSRASSTNAFVTFYCLPERSFP